MKTSERFQQALGYTEQLHREQLRKGTEIPYFSHLMSVCALVMEHGGDEDQVIAALLHDAVEDQGGAPRLEEIRAKFGERVARIVDACTDACVEPKPPWRERKEDYIAGLQHHHADSLLVSCADKLHNARAILSDYRDLGEELWDRFNAGRDGVLWYYRSLADEFRRLMGGRLADELDRTVTQIEALAR